MRRGTQVVILLLFVLALVLAYSLGKKQGENHRPEEQQQRETDTSRNQVQGDRPDRQASSSSAISPHTSPKTSLLRSHDKG